MKSWAVSTFSRTRLRVKASRRRRRGRLCGKGVGLDRCMPKIVPHSRRRPRKPGDDAGTRDSAFAPAQPGAPRSEEHTSELQSQSNLVCRLLLEKKKKTALRSPSLQQHGLAYRLPSVYSAAAVSRA